MTLSQGWLVALFLPIPLVIVASMVLRIWRSHLIADAAVEASRAALEATDRLEVAQEENKRRKREERRTRD